MKLKTLMPTFCCVLCLAGLCSRAAEPSPDVLADPPRADFVLVPLHVHVLSCADREDLDCKITDDDVRRIIGKVNGVWHKAGVHFRMGPILREEAAGVKEFAQKMADRKEISGQPGLELYRMLAPAESGALAGLHVYYIHHFAVNGVFLGQGVCFVQETARLRPVKDGIDEPIPRVTSHELGHAMGLPHRQDVTNLMASGTTGTKINQAEVEIVRARAVKIAGALTVEEAEGRIRAGDKEGDAKEANLLREELKQLGK